MPGALFQIDFRGCVKRETGKKARGGFAFSAYATEWPGSETSMAIHRPDRPRGAVDYSQVVPASWAYKLASGL
jgi:hypothetical protein